MRNYHEELELLLEQQRRYRKIRIVTGVILYLLLASLWVYHVEAVNTHVSVADNPCNVSIEITKKLCKTN